MARGQYHPDSILYGRRYLSKNHSSLSLLSLLPGNQQVMREHYQTSLSTQVPGWDSVGTSFVLADDLAAISSTYNLSGSLIRRDLKTFSPEAYKSFVVKDVDPRGRKEVPLLISNQPLETVRSDTQRLLICQNQSMNWSETMKFIADQFRWAIP